MGKPRVIAETGAGQHGVATATACALLGLECVVYMGTEDMRRQRPNVERMGLLGAEVVEPVEAGARTLKEAVLAAIRDWVGERRDDPLRDRLGGRPGALSGARARPAARDRRRGARAGARGARAGCPTAWSPAWAAAPTRSAPSSPFVDDADVELVGVEAAGEGLETRRHGAPLTTGGAAASCTARCRRCSRTRRARSWRRTRSPPGSTTRASGPSTPTCATPAASRYDAGHGRGGAGRLPRAGAARGDHAGARAGPRDRLAAGQPAARRRSTW